MVRRNRSTTWFVTVGGLIVELKSILRRIIREKGITVVALSRGAKIPVQTLHGCDRIPSTGDVEGSVFKLAC